MSFQNEMTIRKQNLITSGIINAYECINFISLK